MNEAKAVVILNIAFKIALIICFLYVFLDKPDHLAGKGMELRAPFFLGALFILPFLGYIRGWSNYPHFSDILITIPFLLDTLGNIFGLFNTVEVFDDLIHGVNWIFVVMAFQSLRFWNNQERYFSLGRSGNILYGTSVGALLIVLWELVEWVVSVDGMGYVSGLDLSYDDTVLDIAMSVLGGFIGSLIYSYLINLKAGETKSHIRP